MSIKAESFLRSLDMLFQILDPCALGMWFYAPEVEIYKVHDSIPGDTVLLGV